MSEEIDSLPVFVVKSSNWRAIVQLEEQDLTYCSLNNAKFKESKYHINDLCLEACSLALERILPMWRPEDLEKVDDRFGVENGVDFELLDNDAPNLGTLLCVYQDGGEEDENNCIYVPTWEALANAGYYEMSNEAYKEYKKDKKIIEEAMKDINRDNKQTPKKKRKKK